MKVKNSLVIMVSILILLLAAGATVAYVTGWVPGSQNSPGITEHISPAVDDGIDQQWLEFTRLEKPMNVLVVGIDKAKSIKGAARPGPWRSDVLMLIRVEPVDGYVNLLSIPRDTRASIPGHGTEKIAHAHAYGGLPLTVTTVENFLGIKIDHYLSVDFDTFLHIIDLVGPVEVEVQQELKTQHFQFFPGRQEMDGKQAYEYVTNRDEPMADIARIQRQQHFLLALLEIVQQKANSLDLLRLYMEYARHAETTLTFTDVGRLALIALDIAKDEVVLVTLPGKPQYIKGVSYWVADENSLAEMAGMFK
ncbi:MAG TPA: hypothetical protein DEF34_09575 [Desulfotomaculum sp.]|nr:hypothetical protein [Desulfotomaculum sp.]